ncbi:MAG: aldehyde dehydrogenase family protein, partial [Acidimicrobiales bacterium]
MTMSADAQVLGAETRMLIDGALVESASGRRFDNVNPATEEVMGQVADADGGDMGSAIGAARRAFDETDWSSNRSLRRRCLEQLYAAMDGEREAIRAELVAEAGTPVLITYGPQLDAPLDDGLLWPARMIDEFAWERQLPDGTAFGMNSRRQVWKEPVGVVGAIIPWNFPVEITINKLGPVLATGNTVVIKPAPDTPWNATRIGRLIAERTDIPPGVVNVVTSSDHLVGEMMVT